MNDRSGAGCNDTPDPLQSVADLKSSRSKYELHRRWQQIVASTEEFGFNHLAVPKMTRSAKKRTKGMNSSMTSSESESGIWQSSRLYLSLE